MKGGYRGSSLLARRHRLPQWTSPERLRQYIGEPPKENYDVEGFRRTTELINEESGGEMSESVRSALASIDDEVHARAQARAAAVIVNPHPKGLYDDRS